MEVLSTRQYTDVLPRWKGATLSAEAELSAADGGPPSPFDVRFSDPDGPYADLDIGNGTLLSSGYYLCSSDCLTNI